MTDVGPQLGKLIEDGDRRRDAIHVAVAPVTAAEWLYPGQRVGLVEKSNVEMVGASSDPVGVVDPFLTHCVGPGQRFWLVLFPDTVTSLRHIWTHPTFSAAARAKAESP